MIIKVKELLELFDIEVVVEADFEKEIRGAYIGDLLSNVMARANKGDLWITIQGHQNVVAIALLVDMAAVIVVEDFEIQDKAIERAREKGINILRTPLSAYQLAGQLYEKGI